MSERLPALRARDVVRVLLRLGFVFDRQRGSHAVYYRPADGARVVVSLHAGRDIKRKTLRGILRDLKVTPDEFRALL